MGEGLPYLKENVDTAKAVEKVFVPLNSWLQNLAIEQQQLVNHMGILGDTHKETVYQLLKHVEYVKIQTLVRLY